jgi:hypothetical protein
VLCTACGVFTHLQVGEEADDEEGQAEDGGGGDHELRGEGELALGRYANLAHPGVLLDDGGAGLSHGAPRHEHGGRLRRIRRRGPRAERLRRAALRRARPRRLAAADEQRAQPGAGAGGERRQPSLGARRLVALAHLQPLPTLDSRGHLRGRATTRVGRGGGKRYNLCESRIKNGE